MNTRKLSLIAAALMLFSLFAVSAMAAYGDHGQNGNGDGTCLYDGDCPNDGICDNFVDEDGDGVCDNCPNGGICDGTGPHGVGNSQGEGKGDMDRSRDGSCND
ncbi:hypothetical protein SAMN04488589_0178 [Methanolobus vulcani]|jgi:hypothetical protein|uniref:Uncharacterized protein n=1 Tax=Methanolobus vulcani TaxID=38026 RepID=A0A7Z7FBK1_9EURY|nr:hypothetical protein [Methanolobus vulcani]MDK2946999.1 hypothetical protein [Methanolobus sp.]SDF26759.1 hypothetical protein SAMN04488589_0178 [Methanolobus vulcani]